MSTLVYIQVHFFAVWVVLKSDSTLYKLRVCAVAQPVRSVAMQTFLHPPLNIFRFSADFQFSLYPVRHNLFPFQNPYSMFAVPAPRQRVFVGINCNIKMCSLHSRALVLYNADAYILNVQNCAIRED